MRNGDISRKRVLAFVALCLFLLVMFLVSEAERAPERALEKEQAERNANRSAFDRRDISYCNVCGGDGNDCPNCRAGHCPKCGGDGIFYESAGYKNGQSVSSGPYGCYVCGQTGICVECNNKGSCSACRSTGIELKCADDNYCKTCRGTGICLQCVGKGCASCDHGYCSRCDRTGVATA